MKDFTMSMYASEKELYKAKAEYYQQLSSDAIYLLKVVAGNANARMSLAEPFEETLDLFLESLDE